MSLDCLSTFDRQLESTHGLETKFLKVLYYDFPQYYQDSYHSYEYPRLCTILKGAKHVKYGDFDPFTYDESQFILLPPHSTVLMEISQPTRALVLELSDQLIREVTEKASVDLELDITAENRQSCYSFNLSPYVGDAFRHVVDASFSQDRNKAFLMDLHAQELAYYLIRATSIQGILNEHLPNPVLRTIWFMTTNWSEKVSIKELAAMANMSTNAYILQFRKLTGMTPGEYRTATKLGHAREMLRTHTVTETALELGYENISHFIHLFREKYNLTPKQFQKLYAVNLSLAGGPPSSAD
jgi:AraC-like DNA-binding protein